MHRFGRRPRPSFNTAALQDAWHYAALARDKRGVRGGRYTYSTFEGDREHERMTVDELCAAARRELRRGGVRVREHINNPTLLLQMADRACRAAGWSAERDEALDE